MVKTVHNGTVQNNENGNKDKSTEEEPIFPERSESVLVLSEPSWWQRYRAWIISIFVAVILGIVISLIPLPYVIYGPGPTFNVLGEQNGEPILSVGKSNSNQSQSEDTESAAEPETGQPEADDNGQLRMVTVTELGGPGSTVTIGNIVRAWLSPGYSIVPYSQVYPDGISADDVQKASAAQMESSHSTASVAALEYLGYDLSATITVVGIGENSGAKGQLEEGDVLVSIKTPDGKSHPMDTPPAPFALMQEVPVGTDLEVTVLRDGEEKTVTVKSTPNNSSSETTEETAESDSEQSQVNNTESQSQSQGSKLGIYLSVDVADMPVDVEFNLEKVGGPSAGTIFSLGIIDEMTEGDLTGGQSIAGTGSINYDGTVQAIGGIQQKMFGAKRDGADWFLAPESNCDSVVGAIPEGLQVFAVGTLEEAVTAVEAIGQGNTSELTTCEMVEAGK